MKRMYTGPNARRSFVHLTGLALCGLLPMTASAYDCPDNYRYATNGAGQGYCIVDVDRLPVDNAPYCDWLDRGYQGFDYELSTNRNYVCPKGSRQTTNRAGLGFCLWENLKLPEAGADAYCHYLDHGYFGFSWDLCPEGMDYVDNGSTAACVTHEVPPTRNTMAYCHYLSQGYVGYSWKTKANPTYQCGDGARQATNGAGVSTCLYEDLQSPPGATLKPYCHAGHKGMVGYTWQK